MKRNRHIESGTHRGNRAQVALDPQHVALDPNDAAGWMAYAIAYAKKLRFVSENGLENDWQALLKATNQDWSGFLGEENGPLMAEFAKFLADPEHFEVQTESPISQPHVALFVAFLQILSHAQQELNGFTQRHLAHYFYEVLQQKRREARPASTYVQVKLNENAAQVLVGKGTRLKADLPDGNTVWYATQNELELHPATIGEVRSLNCQFEASGLRKMLNPNTMDGGMAAIRAKIWTHVKNIALAGMPWESFEELQEDFKDRENQRNFPLVPLQLRVDEFLQMMTLKPRKAILSDVEENSFRKWEYLHGYMSLRAERPEVQPPSIMAVKTLREKLEAALFLGDSLPDYKGSPVNLAQVYTESLAENKHPDIKLALSYIHEVLFMQEESFQLLYDLSENRKVLPIRPDAIQEAIVRKAGFIQQDCIRKIVTKVSPSQDLLQSPEGEEWHPFGYQKEALKEEIAIEEFGLLLESPLLEMAEGDRSVMLILRFSEMDFSKFQDLFELELEVEKDWWIPFRFDLTGEDDWVEANWRKAKPEFSAASRELKIHLTIPAELPAITSPGEKFPDQALLGKGPSLSIQLLPQRAELGQDTETQYRSICQSLRLDKLMLEVKVEGLESYLLENQEGFLDPTAPFKPFGADAGPGACLKIAHPEICLKPIQDLKLKCNWMELPMDIEANYDSYFATYGNQSPPKVQPHTKEDFKAFAELVVGPRAIKIEAEAIPFFEDQIDLSMVDLPELANHFTKAQALKWKSFEDWPRYLRLRYAAEWFPALEYYRADRRLSAAISQASVDFSVAATAYAQNPSGITNNISNATILADKQAALNALTIVSLEQPYQPELATFSIGYTAKMEIDLAEWKPNTKLQYTLFHRKPFGISQLPTGQGMPMKMFPTFSQEGAFMIGLQKLEAGRPVSFLMKVQEGSGNPDAKPPIVKWKYHSVNGWIPFPARNIIEDQTRGLTETGLLRLLMPQNISVAGDELPGKMHWLMANVDSNSEAMPYFESIQMNAVQAELVTNQIGEAQDISWELPQNSITGFENNLIGIDEVVQPFAATNGRPPETDAMFTLRVSERLRHKNRAVSAWDYEHLCLQEFPNIFAIKTIQAYGSVGRKPGEIGLVLVPDLRNKIFADPYQPKFGFGELNAITEFAKKHASPFAKISATNPNYRPVMVDATIRFKEGISPEMGRFLVYDRLKRFLAPWAFDSAKSLAFGGKLYVSQVVEILQLEAYIDFVGKTKIFVADAEGKYEKATNFDQNGAAYIEVNAEDVLTSAAFHRINELEDEAAKDEIWDGISWMIINSDFQIAIDPNIQPETFEEWMGISWMVIAEDFNLPLDEA